MTHEQGEKTKVNRAQGIDVARALAALAVLTYHVWLYSPAQVRGVRRETLLDYFFFELRIGLVMFFVLSGYLLYRPLVRRGLAATKAADADAGRASRWPVRAAPDRLAVGQYYVRRVVRIVPSYYLALAGSVALLWHLSGTPGVRLPEAAQLPLFLVFGQNYFKPTLLTLDAPTWTLAVQAAFYLVFPLFVLVARPLGARAWLVPVALVAVGIGFNFYAWDAGLGPVARLSLLAMLPYLALGMLAAHFPSMSRRTAWRMIVAGLAITVADLVWHALAGAGDAASILRDVPAAVGFALICSGVGYAGLGHADRLRPVEAFGRWSYGVFLWHLPILLFMQGEDLAPGNAVLRWALLVAVSAAVGAANWRYVERPLIARSRGAVRVTGQ
jgi:peptidoglycan/LPS O-acetylase OafA/YrhL